MLHGTVAQARHLFADSRGPTAVCLLPPMRSSACAPLQRVLLTDGVSKALFEQFSAHRLGPRHGEETGWLLLGVRDGADGHVLAVLPAGARSEAVHSHVRFNTT